VFNEALRDDAIPLDGRDRLFADERGGLTDAKWTPSDGGTETLGLGSLRSIERTFDLPLQQRNRLL